MGDRRNPIGLTFGQGKENDIRMVYQICDDGKDFISLRKISVMGKERVNCNGEQSRKESINSQVCNLKDEAHTCPLISIITITYNAEKELPATMQSVAEQSFHDFEHIIIDGASKDKTLEIASGFQSLYQEDISPEMSSENAFEPVQKNNIKEEVSRKNNQSIDQSLKVDDYRKDNQDIDQSLKDNDSRKNNQSIDQSLKDNDSRKENHGIDQSLKDNDSRKDNQGIEQSLKVSERELRIYSEPDKGLYDAMNKGLRKARGKYILFLNAGDAFHDKNVLEAYAEAAKGDPDIIYADTVIVDEKRNLIGPRHLSVPERLSYKSFSKGMLVCHQAFMVKRSLAPEYDLTYRFSADYDWTLKCLKQTDSSHCVNLEMTAIDYLANGTTDKNKLKSLKERFRIMSKNYGLLPTIANHISFIYRALKRKSRHN